MLLLLILIFYKEKKYKLFYSNFGCTGSDYIFCFMLIMVFMKIVCIAIFMWIVISTKSGAVEIFNILEGDKQKIMLRILRFVSMLFKYLKKSMSKKLSQIF